MDILILAAGRGERMRVAYPYPKPLVPVHGTPMIIRLLYTLLTYISFHKIFIVVRPEDEPLFQRELQRYFPREHNLQKWVFVRQEERHGYGTAAGVQAFIQSVPDIQDHVLILNSDTPMLTPKSLEKMLTSTRDAELCVGTVFIKNPKGYGRIIREDNSIMIVEQKEIPDGHEWNDIHEVNTGIYIVHRSLLNKVDTIIECVITHEKKLTDICDLTDSITTFNQFSEVEIMNINTPLDRNFAENILKKQRDDTLDRILYNLVASSTRTST
jgi:bifunctional UDP-N-acetylglucosamine pyrophosphorylase/glucosamine-1-phosphate N-acetyltransferase